MSLMLTNIEKFAKNNYVFILIKVKYYSSGLIFSSWFLTSINFWGGNVFGSP